MPLRMKTVPTLFLRVRSRYRFVPPGYLRSDVLERSHTVTCLSSGLVAFA